MNMAVAWNYFNKYKEIDKKYLPSRGEGETMASQIVTALTKLVYKWYNDGDVFDNTDLLKGWCNNLSSYANWLNKYVPNEASNILYKIRECTCGEEYEDLLKELVDTLEDEQYLEEMNKQPKVGSIYDCDGIFKFKENNEKEDYYDSY